VTWLLDTNVISEVRKGRRADAGVRAWWAATPDEAIFLSVMVLGEIRHGIESVRRRDPASALAAEQWLLRLSETFRDRVLPVDARIAERWGALGVQDPVPVVDGLLAATALVHGLTLVTRNVRRVERTGVRILDPFDATA
jgi:predicted nucleic acid-binding protein